MDHRRQRLADDRHHEVTDVVGLADPTPLSKHRLGPTIRGGVCYLLGAVLLASACSVPTSSPVTADPNQLVIGIPEANTAEDETGINQVVHLLSVEGLTENGGDGRPRPRLAERWEWEGDDNLRLRVFLRPDVVLHNGSSLTAEVAVELVRKVVTRPINVARYTSFRDIAAVRTDAPSQIVFDLLRPSAMLPGDLSVPLNIDTEGMGTGAFRVVKREGDEVVLEAWNRYYLGNPSIGRVVLRPFDTLRTTWASLLRGELDVVYDVPADAVEFIRNDDVQVVTVPRWYQFTIAFNAKSPALRSVEVRRALNMAIDREALVNDVLRGAGSPSYGPLWTEYWAYDRSMVPPAFDPQRAISLLEDAGLPMMPSRNSDEPPARIRFTCILPANFAVWERIALKVQKDLFDIGVDMRIQVLPVQTFSEQISKGQFDAVLLDMISGPTPGRAYILWASKQRFAGVYNVFGYENSESEELFEVLRTSLDETAVRSATRRLQRVMLEDPPALFLAWSERARAIRRDIITPKTDTHDVMWTLWKWSRSPVRLASRQ